MNSSATDYFPNRSKAEFKYVLERNNNDVRRQWTMHLLSRLDYAINHEKTFIDLGDGFSLKIEYGFKNSGNPIKFTPCFSIPVNYDPEANEFLKRWINIKPFCPRGHDRMAYLFNGSYTCELCDDEKPFLTMAVNGTKVDISVNKNSTTFRRNPANNNIRVRECDVNEM